MAAWRGLVATLAGIVGLALASISHAQAPAAPILEAPTILGLPEASHPSVRRFLNLNTPRVLAFGPNGTFGWQAGGGDAAFVEQTALTNCERRAGSGACTIGLRDLSIVKPGQEWAPSPPPADVAITSAHHATLPDERFIWWGPERARGVLVFAHGKEVVTDLRGRQPQSWTRHFNNAGFDVWRFDREPNADSARRAAAWWRDDLAELRGRGYRQVIVAGQSRGGWNALMVLNRAGLADVAIAIAAAAHGRPSDENNRLHAQIAELEALLTEAAGARRTRLAIADFRDDPFMAEPDKRAEALRRQRERFGAFLLIDRPEGMTGHSAGATTPFNDRYGACLLRFATAPRPPAAC
ncbi:MAG: alpha/beta hydrolase [Roseomonas sp.]|nr:alpha/beta hydrolase [Roseomonas sp.]